MSYLLNNWNDHANRSQHFQADCGCTPPAGENCDKYTGYFSKEYGFEGNNGVTLKAVTCRHLYSYSDPYYRAESFTRNFCNTLRYANGDFVPQAQLPYPCGGDGPTFTTYDAAQSALEDVQGAIEDLQAQSESKDYTRSVLTALLVIVILVMVLIILYNL